MRIKTLFLYFLVFFSSCCSAARLQDLPMSEPMILPAFDLLIRGCYLLGFIFCCQSIYYYAKRDKDASNFRKAMVTCFFAFLMLIIPSLIK